MKITGPDHNNWRVRDLEASLRFYRDVLSLEPFGLEEYHRGDRPLVSLRITEGFVLHLTPDPDFVRASTGGYDHLALVVEGVEPDALEEYLTGEGVEIEERFESITGARGEGPALYVRDPDGYRVELKFYWDRERRESRPSDRIKPTPCAKPRHRLRWKPGPGPPLGRRPPGRGSGGRTATLPLGRPASRAPPRASRRAGTTLSSAPPPAPRWRLRSRTPGRPPPRPRAPRAHRPAVLRPPRRHAYRRSTRRSRRPRSPSAIPATRPETRLPPRCRPRPSRPGRRSPVRLFAPQAHSNGPHVQTKVSWRRC